MFTLEGAQLNYAIFGPVGIPELLLILLLALIILPYFWVVQYDKRVAVDGLFDDWAAIYKY